MIIAVFDVNNFRFTKDLIAHWESLGYIVLRDKMFDPKLCINADVLFFDDLGNDIARASHEEDNIWKQISGGQLKNKKIIVRCHDITGWVGAATNVNWIWVHDLIFVAQHIQDHVDSYMHFAERYPHLKIHSIKHGIDDKKFTFRKHFDRKIAWFGPFNEKKCFELALLVLLKLPNYELHAVGKELRNWRRAYVLDFIKRNNLKVTFYDEVPDVNEFLEDKTFLLTSGFKEAFGYIIGEAAMKGLIPVVHHFYGAENVWPKEWLWDDPEKASAKIMYPTYIPEEYRQYVIDNYPLNRMLAEYDALL